MPVVIIALALLALLGLTWLGHAALCVGYVNRVHSFGAPRSTIKFFSVFGHGLLVFLPLLALGLWIYSGQPLVDWLSQVAECRRSFRFGCGVIGFRPSCLRS
jgi:hypothetical protein